MPGERKVASKKDAGPRALALLRLGTDGKTSLVPIAILINGRFWDASSYKADPVPMALEQGTIYEAERTGNSLGLFTVVNALHSNAANAPVPWLATGTWRPTGTEPATKDQKAESVPVGIGDTDAPPRLTRDPNRLHLPPANPAPASGSAGPASSSAPSDKPNSPGSDSDEPPRLTKGTSTPSEPTPNTPPVAGQGQPAPSTPPAGSAPAAGESKPEATKGGDTKANAKTDTVPAIPASDSGASEANRPRLRRGKPEESFADQEVPGYSRPGAKPAADAGKLAAASTLPGAVQLIPAISDATVQQVRPFNFDWLKGEEDDRRKQMMVLAKDQLHAYLQARAKATTTSKATHSRTVRQAAQQEPIFGDVKMVAYDLWRSNQPVIVLSADAHLPPPPAGTAHSEVESELQYSILIVAYPDIYDNLHQLYAKVTDKFHLDVTPRLELIDAVDADGDGVGELLFRETSDAGTGWVIYRVTADRLWKRFDSLSPEG